MEAMTANGSRSPLLTVAETADRLRISEKTVRRLIDRGELPSLRVGVQIRIDQSELESWLYADSETVARLKEDILAALDRNDSEELERLQAKYRRTATIERPLSLKGGRG
jgi:excisionase family DNA binding protein